MSRPKDRASAAGLLPLMEARPWADGKTVTYRYHPIGGKPMNLGQDRKVALQQVLDMTSKPVDSTNTLAWVWDKHITDDPRWKRLSQLSRDDYTDAWMQIKKTFGAMQAADIDSSMVARYVHIERKDAPRRANIERSVLSNLFGYGILLGACKVNATIGVQLHHSVPRSNVPQGEVLAKFLEWLTHQTPQRQIVGKAAEYASLAGSRKCEFLSLTWPQIDWQTGEIRVFRGKRREGRPEIVDVLSISADMAALLHRLEAVRPDRECLHVFPTRDGNAYSARGFKTLWQRCVVDAIKAGILLAADRFTFHDLRAFYASTHKKQTGALPDMHQNPATTAQVYDRNIEVKRRSL